MAHLSTDIISESIRHELRLFAQDTFQAELMRVGDRVEQGLREQLSEFLKIWAASEGKRPDRSEAAFPNGSKGDQICSDDVIQSLPTVTEDDNQSGWFKNFRKSYSTTAFLHGSKKAAEQQMDSKSSDEGVEGMTGLTPPMLRKATSSLQGGKDSSSDALMYRHPKRFTVGQEGIHDRKMSISHRFKISDQVNNWVRPPPPGAAETLPVMEHPKSHEATAKSRTKSPTNEDGMTFVKPFVIEPSTDKNFHEHMDMAGIVPTNIAGQNDSVLDDCLLNKRTSGAKMGMMSSESTDISFVEPAGVQKHRWRRIVSDIVLDARFDYITGFLIVMNSIVIGVQTDYMARHTQSDEVPVPFAVIERIFCVAFTLELCMRLVHYGKLFFYGSGWRWNVFDTVIVALQLIEELMNFIAVITESDKHGQQIESFSIMRMLRVLRLIRIIRLVRVLRLISELRTIVVSIIGSMRSLGWTIVLLVLMMYIIGVFLTQLVSQHMVEHGDRDADGDGNPDLGLYYNNLGRSILTLFQSISGGVDWDDSVQPLMTYLSPWLALMFSFYIAFAVFALFNIVTGVFVESALATAKGDEDILLMHNVRQLFATTDIDRDGRITLQEFEDQLCNEQMEMYFQAIDLDKEEARELFKLIDIDDSGSIDPEEFLNGCFRLRGPAKALDLAVLMHNTRRMNKKWFAHVKYVETALSLMLRQGGPSQHRSPEKPLAVM